MYHMTPPPSCEMTEPLETRGGHVTGQGRHSEGLARTARAPEVLAVLRVHLDLLSDIDEDGHLAVESSCSVTANLPPHAGQAAAPRVSRGAHVDHCPRLKLGGLLDPAARRVACSGWGDRVIR